MPPSGRAAVATILTFCLLLLNNVSATEHTYIASQQVTAQDFLQAHNEVRAMFNEPMLTWDDKLAAYAHLWAEKTSALGKCEERYHSHGPYGENLFWGWSWNDYFSPRDAVMMWTEEKNDFDVKSLRCTPGKMCGHFTQVVWRNSKRVGCSRIKCAQGGVLMICNYDPPGNWIDSKLEGLMNPFGEDKTTVPPVSAEQVPQAVPHIVPQVPKVPQPVQVDGHPTVTHPVPAEGHPTVPHPVPAEHQPAFSRPPSSGGELPKKGRGRNRRGQGRGGHHPGRAKPNQNRSHRNRNGNHHHLSPRQRYLNRIGRRRQRDNRKP